MQNEQNFLCPHCHELMADAHIVQCSSCQTIIGILPQITEEKSLVFFVDKCSHCNELKIEKKNYSNRGSNLSVFN